MEVLTDGEYFIEDNSVRPPREWKRRNGMDNALVYVMSIEENIPKNNALCKELWKKVSKEWKGIIFKMGLY